MKIKRSLLLSSCFFAMAVLVAAWLYPRLPAAVPTHWDLQGHVNGTMPRIWGAAMPALAILGLAMLSWLLDEAATRQKNAAS